MQDEEVKIPKGYNYEESFNYLTRILNELQHRIYLLESAKRRTAIVKAIGGGIVGACTCNADYTGLTCRCVK